jgi:uncharacterized protein YdhG (YjbR/CyaY superfamily)
MAKTDYQSIDEYHSAFSPELQARMQSIRKLIHEVVPEVEETISYQIPCFKYQGYLIYYAAFPNHISLSNPFSQAFLQEFAQELKNYKVSKSVIQLPNKDELPLVLIKRMIAFRKKENDEEALKKRK